MRLELTPEQKEKQAALIKEMEGVDWETMPIVETEDGDSTTSQNLSPLAKILERNKVKSQELMACPEHPDVNLTRTICVNDEKSPWSKCVKCLEEQEKKEQLIQERQLQREKEQLISRLLIAAKIPKRYAIATVQDFISECEKSKRIKDFCIDYVNNFEEKLDKGVSAILFGNKGAGKTHLTCAVLNDVVRKYQKSVLFTTAIDAMAQIKETYGQNSIYSEREVLERFYSPSLLVLDDVGVQYGTQNEQVLLFQIINKRYNDMLPTFVTTNLSRDEMTGSSGGKVYFDARLIERMRENGGIACEFNWKSRRA